MVIYYVYKNTSRGPLHKYIGAITINIILLENVNVVSVKFKH